LSFLAAASYSACNLFASSIAFYFILLYLSTSNYVFFVMANTSAAVFSRAALIAF